MSRNAALKVPSVPEVLRNALLRARMVNAELELVLDERLLARSPALFEEVRNARTIAQTLQAHIEKAMQEC